ncbi:hypothetical protein CDAR_303091 [Caerostris darwini]|uniref:Uncharacterized protein n=1 Tax=Caerostris darwini TaxID=1538125 RepID=A0AAV4V3J9_9ARAC|nr:hypothetical protein CDAR_303091 [Caerostris darwini]
MDFFFHDDILSLFFDVGSVYVSESIRKWKSSKSIETCQAVEYKLNEQLSLHNDENQLKLVDIIDDVSSTSTNNCKRILLDEIADAKPTFNIVDEKDSLNHIVDVETTSSKQEDLLDDNTDLEPILKTDENKIFLKGTVDDKPILKTFDSKVLRDDIVDLEPISKVNEKEILLNEIDDMKPTSISNENDLKDIVDAKPISDTVGNKVLIDDKTIRPTVSNEIKRLKRERITESKRKLPKQINRDIEYLEVRSVSSCTLKSKLVIPQNRRDRFLI